MSQPDGREQFLRDVFPAEIEEINQRRRQLHIPEVPPDSAPSAKLGLVGFALSGGGFIGSCLSSLLNDKDVGPEQERFPLNYMVRLIMHDGVIYNNTL